MPSFAIIHKLLFEGITPKTSFVVKILEALKNRTDLLRLLKIMQPFVSVPAINIESLIKTGEETCSGESAEENKCGSGEKDLYHRLSLRLIKITIQTGYLCDRITNILCIIANNAYLRL